MNILEQLGLNELLEDDNSLFDVEDILDSVTLPQAIPCGPEQGKRSRLRKTLPLILNIATYLICIAVIVVSVILRFSGYNGSFFGFHIYHVVSQSMTPTMQADGTIPKGGFLKDDAIIVKNTVPEKVQVGDVITFWSDEAHEEEPITHRVVEINNLGGSNILFRTKGDNNKSEDPDLVPGDQLIGVKVLVLPKLGKVLSTAQAHPWITIGISAGILIVVFGLFLLFNRRSAKKSARPPRTHATA